MFTIPELTEYFKCSRDAVVSWIVNGELTAIDVAPTGSKRRHYRVTREAVEDFERRRRCKVARRREPDHEEERVIPKYI